MNKTKIEWCDYTINPVKGKCPMGCSYCYARRMYDRFKWNPEIRLENVFSELNHIPLGSKVFWGSTIELFGEWIRPTWLERIFREVRNYPELWHIFLTKCPQNLIKWSPFPENCWVGITATNDYDIINRIGLLGLTKAPIKFVSIEPLLSWDAFTSEIALKYLPIIQWLIIGQQTPVSKKTEPKIEWIREIVEAADKAKIPVFLKDNILELVNYNSPQTDFAFNREGCYRQEFPKSKELSHA